YATETARLAARTLDIPGQITAVLALGSLAAAMIEGGERGWSNVFVLASFALLAALFLAVEFRSKAPMLPLGLFRKPAFSAMSLTGLLVNIGCYGLIFVFSLYFQRLNHFSPLLTGLAFAPMMAAVLATNLIAARVTAAIGTRLTIATGLAVTTLSCLALLGLQDGTPYAALCGQLIGLAADWGCSSPR